MNNIKPWAPRSLPPEWQTPLAVLAPKSQPMTAELHQLLLSDKLAALVKQAEPWELDEARELLADLQLAEPAEWPALILQSDPMQSLLARIRWEQEDKGRPPLQADLKEALAEQSLASVLGSL